MKTNTGARASRPLFPRCGRDACAPFFNPARVASLFVLLLLAFFAARSASAAPIATVELRNPHAFELRGSLVTVPVAKWKLKPSPVQAVSDGKTFPAQLEDHDGDGRADTLAFLADMASGANAKFDIVAAPEAAPPGTAVRTLPAWESEKFGFRSYGPLLIDLFARRSGGYGLKLDKFFAPDNTPCIDYHKSSDDGMDVLHINQTLGLAGVFATDGKTTASPPADLPIAARILACGPARALLEMKLGPWESPWGKITFTRTASIAAGHFGTRITDRVSYGGKTPLQFGIGLRKEGPNANMARLDDPAHHTVAHRFTQDQAIGPAGIGLYFPAYQPRELPEDDANRYFATDSAQPIEAVAFGFWSGEEEGPIEQTAAIRAGTVRSEQFSPEVVSAKAR